jgi:hypothetical protein
VQVPAVLYVSVDPETLQPAVTFDESRAYPYEPVPVPPDPVKITVLLLGLKAALNEERLTAD